MKFAKVFLISIFLILPVPVSSADVIEYRLKNGLEVIVVEEHKAPVATFQVWYRSGSKDEPAGKSGISHLLEHMMFKGTSRYGPSELSRIVQRNGGTDNAYTTKDYTVYFELLSSDRITLAIDLEADRMQKLLLDGKEVLSERSVVVEERRLRYEDDPQNSLFEEVVAAAFKVHPYRRPVIGWMSDLSSIDRDDLYSFYRTNYSPRNAVILVVGDVDSAGMEEKIRSAFENIPRGPAIEKKTSVEPEQKGEKRLFLRREAELPFIITAYHVPCFPNEDSYALDVLNQILSGGKSSRLYRSLVYKKKVALTASADYSGFNMNPYLFFFFINVSPGRDVSEAENSLCEEIDKIKKRPPGIEEVKKAKNQIESSFIMSQDSIYVQAMKYGMFEMLGDWRLMNQYIAGIRKVTPEDVLKVAQKYFVDEKKTTGILIPTKETVKSEE
jgi:zinc protease